MHTKKQSKKKLVPLAVLTTGAILISGIGLGVGGYSNGIVEAHASSNRTVTEKYKEPKIKTMYLVKKTANVRQKASATSKVIEWAPKGSVIEGLDEKGKWIKVKQDGKTGYVSSKVLKELNTFEVEKAKYEYAKAKLKGFKEVSKGVFVSYFEKKPLITVDFHNEDVEHMTITINYELLIDGNSRGGELFDSFNEKLGQAISTQWNENSPESKEFEKKQTKVDYSQQKAYHFTVGNKNVTIDQSELYYALKLSFTPKEESLKITEKKWLKAEVNSSFLSTPNQVKAYTFIKQGTLLEKVGETKTLYYVKYKGKYGYVKKDSLVPTEKVLSKETLSRAEMNKEFESVMTKVSENKYVLKDGKKEIASISFESKTSTHPMLKMDEMSLYLLSTSGKNLDENKSKTEKELEAERSKDGPLIVDSEGNVVGEDGVISGKESNPYDFYSKEEIIKANNLKKMVDPIIKKYVEVQLGKETKEAKKLYSLFYDEDYTIFYKLNGQNHYFKPNEKTESVTLYFR